MGLIIEPIHHNTKPADKKVLLVQGAAVPTLGADAMISSPFCGKSHGAHFKYYFFID